jgi:hypothetical protein
LAWNGATGEHVKWKVALDDGGHSSPIVWEDRVFVTGCNTTSGERALSCFSVDTGALLWRRVVFQAPLERKHALNSFASGTPATDGELIYATLLKPDFGSETDVTPGEMVVAAFDLDGQLKWQVEPGRFSSIHGYCSSPVIFEDLLIVNGDHDGNGYLVALHRNDGSKAWKVDRPNKTRSYVTPIIREFGGRTQLIMSGSKSVTSYDPRTGGMWWYMDGPTEQFVASMVDNGELVFLTAGFPEHHILAIRPDGAGTISDSHVIWRTTRNCSYVPSPIVMGEYFLVAADNGVVSCLAAESGELHWVERMGKQYSASLAACNGLVYLIADDGETKIVRPGKTVDLVAENQLGENCFASPAISGGRLFLRGEQHLYCIE